MDTNKPKKRQTDLTSLSRWLFLGLCFFLLGSDSSFTPTELSRRGNVAAQNDKLEQALEWYGKAERRTTDPGFIAFNKATMLYQLERFREAEQHYERALAGSEPVRRAKTYLGLGNAKLKRSAGTDVSLLENAIACFRLCRDIPEVPNTIRDRAVTNLEIARLLLAKAKAELAKQKDPQEPQNDKSNPGGKRGQSKENSTEESKAENQAGDLEPDKSGQKPKQGEVEKRDDAPAVPGKGNLPTLPDEENLKPIDPEDAREYLEQLIERLQRQRENLQPIIPRKASSVKDW